ncbi:MAG TPA: hypothetical protein VFV37_10690 [Luteibaculaceae bacterium]|jgi:hypothetical protein|nr:hypothetical protein [Luteibaculaceae bacterium]
MTSEIYVVIAFVVGLIPAGIVTVVCLNIIRGFLDDSVKKEAIEIKKEASRTTLPLRIQAYERLVIFLERIRINSLVMRVHRSGMDAEFFQAELLKTIRSEFEHNVSQQLYVSDSAWQLVVFAKEETIQILNIASRTATEGTGATDFSRILFDINSKLEHQPVDEAIKFIRKEMRKFF